MRPTVMEIDLNNFEYNIEQIQKFVGENTKIMPVIKANGYGTYINKKIDVLNKFDIVAVAIVDEAIALRKIGYEKEIFVLNQPYESEIEDIIKYNIIPGISSYEFAEKLGETGEKITVHVEIGTGMGRTGVHPYKIERYLKSLPENIKVEGIYTHFSSADSDKEYTEAQLISFKNAVKTAKEILGEIKYIHAAASNALLYFKEAHFNLVRPGIIIYGYPGDDKTYDVIDLKPIAKLKTKITFLKEVVEGTSIGYGRSYITKRPMTKVATIPIGYADGLRRDLSNCGEVLINGKKVPIIGNVCMDSFMADVTDLEEVSVGDDVYIWDNENITLEDISKKCNTINYEIISTISERVPRIFK